VATTKEVLAREAREAEEWAKQNARSMAESGARYRRMSSWEGSTWSKTVESLLLPVKDGGYGLYPLSPIFALLAPFVDITAETAYTDVRARVGVGLAFFYEWDDRLRAFALAHEALHVANRHFQRADEMGGTFEGAHRMLNLAGDMEINDLLRNMGVARSGDEDRFVFPEGMGYERSRTMEEYLVALSGDMEKLRELARQLAAAAGESGSSGDGCGGSSGESGSQGSESGSAPGSSDEPGSDGSQGGQSGSAGSQGGSGSSSGNGGGSQGGQSGSGSDGSESSSGSGGSSSEGGEVGSSSGSSSVSSGDNEGGEDGDGQGGWTRQYVRQHVAHACGSRSTSEDDRDGERIEGETGVRGRELADVEGARQDAEALVREAAEGNANIGDGEGNVWVRLLTGMAPPRVHWQSVLAGVVGRSMSSRVRGNRYATYRRPNRRRQGGEFLWPSREDNKPTVHVAVDTSGSMGRSDYARAVSEIEGILRTSASGAAIGFYGVDTRMTEKPRMVSHVRDMKALGGGGTDMAVPYEWMRGEWEAGGKRRRELPDVHVLITDGYVYWGETFAAAAKCRQFTRMVIVVTNASEDKRVIEDGRAAGVSVVFVNE
jgi:spore wall protein 1